MNKLNWPQDLINSFFSKVQVPQDYENECWIWTAYKDKDGYGKFRSVRAHREMYKFYFGVIPVGMNVCHTCDNPACVNPNHFWLGTSKQNTQDRTNKLRSARGETIASSKLTNSQVELMFSNIMDGKYTSHQEIAEEFNISTSSIYRIINNSWDHLKLKTGFSKDDLKNQLRKSSGKLTDDDLKEIIQGIGDGTFLTTFDIAIKFNKDVTFITKILRKKLLKTRLDTIISDSDLEKLYESIKR